MIKSKRLVFENTDDFTVRTLGDILDSDFPFTQVFITVEGGNVVIGDSNLSTTEFGAKITSGQGRVLFEFNHRDDVCNNLYLRSAIAQDDVTIYILAF